MLGGAVGAAMRLESLIPVLDVRDVDASIQFYCDALGFRLLDKVEWGGRTEWALLGLGHVQLMLCVSQDPASDETSNLHEGVFFVYLDNLEELKVYLGSKGYLAGPAIPHSSQNGRDFYVRDPDGYILWFSRKPALGRTVRSKKGTSSVREPAPS